MLYAKAVGSIHNQGVKPIIQGKDTRGVEGDQCEAIYQIRTINRGRDMDFGCCWLEMASYKQMK